MTRSTLQPSQSIQASADPDRHNEANSLPFWRSLLACPSCGTPLPDVRGCDACNVSFGDDGGTPRIIVPHLRRDFTMHFSQDRSVVSHDLIRTLITDPPAGADQSDMPYHMDPAHAFWLNQLQRPLHVLEVGCGGGQCRHWFHGKGFQYVGVDVSKTRIHDWLQRWGGPDLLCDSHFLPFRGRSFDVVYSAAVTEHLACPQLAVREIFRVLKPRGFYLGNVSFLEPWHDNSFFHMTPLGVAELLVGAGFTPRHIWPSRGYSGYQAICAMGFRGPLRFLKYFGKLEYAMYRLQSNLLASARRVRHRPISPDILDRAKVAGATDWIAQRPPI